MAGYLRTGVAVLLLVCFTTQTYCQLEAVTVLNQADEQAHEDCGSLMKAGYNVSGVYRLALGGKDVQIPCEFVEEKAYTLILRRVSNDLSFFQSMQVYDHGFGHPMSNYWAGLSQIYLLNQAAQTRLSITMQDWNGESVRLSYQIFRVGPSSSGYKLQVGGYRGPAGLDDLTYNNGMAFYTFDVPDPTGCANHNLAGWWYNSCTQCLPTGHYYNGPYSGSYYDGIFWKSWHGLNYSLKFFSMALST